MAAEPQHSPALPVLLSKAKNDPKVCLRWLYNLSDFSGVCSGQILPMPKGDAEVAAVGIPLRAVP